MSLEQGITDSLIVKNQYDVAQQECEKLGIHGNLLETATGFTFEITDIDCNKIGFADYKEKPKLARK